jgi:hypothetical protein
MLHAAMPALRSASSKLDRRSRCFPTPLVRKIFFATNAMSSTGLRCLHEIESKKPAHRKLASTRSDVNGIQRACVFSASQACRLRADYYSLMKVLSLSWSVFAPEGNTIALLEGRVLDPPVRSPEKLGAHS